MENNYTDPTNKYKFHSAHLVKGRASLTFKVCISEFVTSQLVQKPHGSVAIKKKIRIPGQQPFCCLNSNLWMICASYNTQYVFVLIHSVIPPNCGHVLFTAIGPKHHCFEFPGSLNSDSGSVVQAGHQHKVSALHHSGIKLNSQLYLTSCTFNVTFFCDRGGTCERTTSQTPVHLQPLALEPCRDNMIQSSLQTASCHFKYEPLSLCLCCAGLSACGSAQAILSFAIPLTSGD